VTLRAEQAGLQRGSASDALEHLRPGLELLALRTLGSLDASREAVQETLARAVVALANGQPSDPTKLAAFVAGIARHVIVDMVRAARRVIPLEVLPAGDHPASNADALTALVSAAERARVRHALALLSPRDQELLRLCYFEGLSPAEIAARLRQPAERVRKRKSRALERLRLAFRNPLSHESSSSPTDSRGGPDT
jgi:RNA polymerase sigma-70 factor (ECF subfamily)